MVSIKNVSIRCGLSISTVSKALNNRPDISPETREYVCQVAKEMGYLPNSAARSLKTHRSYNIGVLFVDKTQSGLAHEYFSTVLGSLQYAVGLQGYDVTFIGQNIGRDDMSYYEHCRYRGCDGVVIASADFTDPAVIELLESDLPVVTIDFAFPGRTGVLSDNARGLRELAAYILGRGHRKIAFIHGEDTEVTRKRLAGFYEACEKAGLAVPDRYLRAALYHDPRSAARATRELLSLPERPSCILYPDDFSFLGGREVIEEFGLSVPEDISVAGFDGIELSQLMRPKLTTLRQDVKTLGQKAGGYLIERIERPTSEFPSEVLVPGLLIEGESVKEFSCKKGG